MKRFLPCLTIGMALLLEVPLASANEVVTAASPKAPRISCGISLPHWCLVQNPGIVTMTDDGHFRTWHLTAEGSDRVAVVIREDKRCDSSGDPQLRRIAERDVEEGSPMGGRWHAVDTSLTQDGACTLRVEYPVGNDDWAREGQRMARHWILACDSRRCIGSVLGANPE